jgi:hypothetical protein
LPATLLPADCLIDAETPLALKYLATAFERASAKASDDFNVPEVKPERSTDDPRFNDATNLSSSFLAFALNLLDALSK